MRLRFVTPSLERKISDHKIGNLNVADEITLLRAALVVIALIFLHINFWFGVAGALLIPFAFYLDHLDGFIARRFNLKTTFGSFLDVVADRAKELMLLVFFLSVGLVPAWIVMVFVVRGLITDTIRSKAQSEKKSTYGMINSTWGKIIVSSRISRGLYAVLKAAWFTVLAVAFIWPQLELYYVGQLFGYVAVGYNILRALPVIVEGRRLFR